MNLALQFPEAYRRGQRDCEAYYAESNRGEPQTDNYSSNPYPTPDASLPSSQRTEWHAYNAGWNGVAP